ncbi:hypothetical protein [Phyllobacterium bourgognense]|uniref:Uncharacterized protein n=1 Tax=Phyllobacterium bourgognense TaxID=314236 RepID=A0A368YBR8_9HYPH|nr:hypothetical protein [Phyllobacterium bourgognense]RCW77701.1 hypothetical protein C7476_1398 [Phyllobacterium bourgognense]
MRDRRELRAIIDQMMRYQHRDLPAWTKAWNDAKPGMDKALEKVGLETEQPRQRRHSARLRNRNLKEPSKLYVTKLAAAKRQLCAAIRMFFDGEDELAVHTVAHAAYKLLSNIKTTRGRDEAADDYLNMVFYHVQEYRRGTLPSFIANDPEMMQFIRDIADRLPINASSRFTEVTASVTKNVAKDFWDKRSKVANFLKHADRDPKAYLDSDEVDNLTLLTRAHGAYVDLTHTHIDPEGIVLWVYSCVTTGMAELLPSEFKDKIAALHKRNTDEKLRFCSRWLHELRNPGSHDQ